MRLIDADWVISALNVFNDKEHGNRDFLLGIASAKEIVENTPTIEPAPTAFIPGFTITSTDGQAEVRLVPERHGKWIYVEDVPLEDGQTEYDREAWYQCSECDAYDLRLKDCHADYCWSCGAKMDEEEEEEEDESN